MSCGAAGKVTPHAERAVGQLRSSSADSHRLQQALGRDPELQRLFLPRKPLTLPWKHRRILQPSAQARGILPRCPSRSDLGSRTPPYWTFLQSYFFCKAGWYSSAKGKAPGSHPGRVRLGGSWDGAGLRAAAQHRALPGQLPARSSPASSSPPASPQPFLSGPHAASSPPASLPLFEYIKLDKTSYRTRNWVGFCFFKVCFCAKTKKF